MFGSQVPNFDLEETDLECLLISLMLCHEAIKKET